MKPVKPIKFIVIGSVDNGKSTLCGHLLYKSNYVVDREWEKIQQQAQIDGMEKWKFARILDILKKSNSEEKPINILLSILSIMVKSFNLLIHQDT